MAARRLSDSEKQDLVGRYKAGESTAALAEAFGCSSNTVSRTVKALLPPEAYAALKASRQKGGTVVAVAQPLLEIPLLEIPPLEVPPLEVAPNGSTDAEPISSDEASAIEVVSASVELLEATSIVGISSKGCATATTVPPFCLLAFNAA